MCRNHSQDALRESIKHHTQNLRIFQSELAEHANVSRPLITSFISGRLNLSPSSMERVQKALLELIQERAAATGFVPALPSSFSRRPRLLPNKSSATRTARHAITR